MRRNNGEGGDEQSHPVKHRRNCQGINSDSRLNNREGKRPLGKAVSEPATEESAETDTCHIGAEHNTNSIIAVAKNGYELATPEDFKKQRGKA